MYSLREKQLFGLAFGVLSVLALVACGPSAGEVDSRIATAIASIPTPTPQPTATPQRIPSWDEIDKRIDRAIDDIPTATPQPSATPQPVLTLEEVDARVAKAMAEFPTPVPPVLVAVASSASGTGEATLGGGVVLRIDPGRPVAGRNISFTVSGLKPWQQFSVRFVDPQGNPAQWVLAQESLLTQSGAPGFDRTMFAGAAGQASWMRVETRDSEGTWSVRIKVDSSEYVATYTVAQVQLDTTEVHQLGLDFRRYHGSAADSFTSALVPTSLAVDMQSHLLQVVNKLEARLAFQSSQVPDIYLLGNQTLLEAVAKAAGAALNGWEAGFYYVGGTNPGIYIKTDELETQLRQTVTHEYVHLALSEKAPKISLPAWVNEGTAVYYELTLGQELPGTAISRREAFWRADMVKAAAIGPSFIPLTALESQKTWGQGVMTVRLQLQYAEAYMAVRYLVERYGDKGLSKVLDGLAAGRSLDASLALAVGVSYAQFQTDYLAWVRSWTDPSREAMRAYAASTDVIMQEWEAISTERTKTLGTGNVSAEAGLLVRAKVLDAKVSQLSPSAEAAEEQALLAAFVKRAVDWLQLEYDYVSLGVPSKLTEANNMIPEIDAREKGFYRAMYDLKVEYNLI